MTEGMTTEFKREYTDDIKKTIIAFANTRGGEVLIGVEDDGTVIGVLDVDGTMLKVTNAMRDSIKPDIIMFLLCEKREMDGKEFKSVTEEDALPQTDEEKKQAEEKAEAGKPVLEAVKEALGDQVKEVRVSAILKSGACCLSADGPISIEMEKYMSKMEGGQPMKADRVLELNADSAPFAALRRAVETEDKELVSKYSRLLYAQALLLAGLPLEDPAEYTELVCSLMI